MADSVRKIALAALASACATTSVKTVVVANAPVDMTRYKKAQVPLVEIIPTGETPFYSKSSNGHALWKVQIGLTCYFLDDIGEEAQQETLVKELKDAVGHDPTLGNKCQDLGISRQTNGGEFPLWKVTFDLEMTYERACDSA